MTNQTLFDAFEVWLQGQINTAVAGHASRIERLEERLQTQDGYTKHLEETIDKLAKHVQAMLVPQTMCADDLLEKLREAEDWVEAVPIDELFGSSEFQEAIDEKVFEGRALKEAVTEIIADDIRFEVTVR